MNTMIKNRKSIARGIAMTLIFTFVVAMFAGCGEYTPSATEQNKIDTEKATETLLYNQATPTDIEYSLERFNLTKRAYWVNGLWEKANAVPCPIQRPIGYIACLSASGAVVYTGAVDGKVSSLNSYLSPDSEYYEYSAGETSRINNWLADVDGSYGENIDGVFWFTPDGHYKEWRGDYLYGDEPFEVKDPILTIKTTEE